MKRFVFQQELLKINKKKPILNIRQPPTPTAYNPPKEEDTYPKSLKKQIKRLRLKEEAKLRLLPAIKELNDHSLITKIRKMRRKKDIKKLIDSKIAEMNEALQKKAVSTKKPLKKRNSTLPQFFSPNLASNSQILLLKGKKEVENSVLQKIRVNETKEEIVKSIEEDNQDLIKLNELYQRVPVAPEVREKLELKERKKLSNLIKKEDKRYSHTKEVPLDHQKSLMLTILGPPNSGKSSFLNYVTNDKIAATSSKAQTTRSQITGIYTHNNVQLVLLDTPGVVTPDVQKKLNTDIVVQGWLSLAEAELVVIMADASRDMSKESYRNLYYFLEKFQKELAKIDQSEEKLEIILLLNKIDKLLPKYKRNKKIQSMTEMFYKEYPFISKIFPISIRSNMNVNDAKNYIYSRAKERIWSFPAGLTCEMTDLERVHEIIRQQVFRRFNEEIPYGVTVEIVDWSELGTGEIRVEVNMFVKKMSIKKIIVGTKGASLEYVIQQSQVLLEDIFKKKFKIFISVKIREQH